MLKLIYLAKRKPGFTTDQFTRRWRKHGTLAMEQGLWREALGYVQAEPVRPTPIKEACEDFDAVACYMVNDTMFETMNEDDMAGTKLMLEDELETFAEPIFNVSLWVREESIKAGELGGMTAFQFFSSNEAARKAAVLASASTDLHRVILNERDDISLGAEANTLPYQAVVELATYHPAALQKLDAEVLKAADLMVVTREAVLWDRLPEPSNR